ncbi:MAG: hypothetical protein NTV51_01290 [Verrucomicrobia bacterium]|nr:hypothetical protein [Verrucomicrobiota bacterium]
MSPADLPRELAVVAHDAGAANFILGWLEDRPDLDLRLCAAGPAARLFALAWPGRPLRALPEALRGARALLSGTSGPHSTVEHDARRSARRLGVPSIGVIDHWVNYRERFERNGTTELPDELWVADEYAERLARTLFDPALVHRQTNRYLEKLAARALAAATPHPGFQHVLYVLEPMRSTWGRGDQPGEFQALDYFLSHWAHLGWDVARTRLRLRPHPSEEPGKYLGWLRALPERPGFAGVEAGLDSTADLTASLGWADHVVGCESFALTAALAAGRRAYSSLPPWAPPCRLPHTGIIHLRVSGK